MKARRFIWEKGISIAIIITIILVGCSALLSFYVRYQVDQFNATKDQVEEAKFRIEQVSTHVNLMDMGLRGYLLVQEDKMLDPYYDRYQKVVPNLDTLEMILASQNYPTLETHQKAKRVIVTYQEVLTTMIQLANNGQLDRALEILMGDPGYDAWVVYGKHLAEAAAFEDTLYEEARRSYQQLVDTNAIMQMLLLIMGVPTLFFVIYQINKARRSRAQLFEELERSQRDHLFDDGLKKDTEDERTVVNGLIENLSRASHFIGQISQGDHSVIWEGLTDENQEVNQENLAGALIHMREQMKERKQEDQQRLWSTEGLSKVAEITRVHQENAERLADQLLSYLVNYTGSNQGSLFFLREDEVGQSGLWLTACYAYDKKRHAERRIEIGQGLVGQTYLERKTLHLRQVPDQYVSITSGLGEATPSTLLLIPLIFNEQVMGVLEMASFEVFQDHQIAFLEDVGEVIASAVATVRMNTQTKELLEQSQEGTETLRAQEEEMRQNMEELQATQEEMERKAQEYEEVIEEQQKTIQRLEQIND